MIPAGYMAKCVSKRPDWLSAPNVDDILSVSGCVSEDFDDYIDYWKHNDFWFFDSPETIVNLAKENSILLQGTSLFYYEIYEMEFDGKSWNSMRPDLSASNVMLPHTKQLQGFDVVTFYAKSSPECSPLSCNSLAEELPTNSHCLFDSFDQAKFHLDEGVFNNSEPGPYRIFAVYSVPWS
jgi:hypothetical protein